MKNNNLAIIGASYLQKPLIEKAKEMGYITHVFAWASNDVGEKIADYFYPISIVEKEKILNKCKEIGICAICSIASDLANITVNYVAEKLGLTCNGITATEKSTNKYIMRQTFIKNGDPSPRCFLINDKNLENLEINFPSIVKPTDRSGSRGIYKVENFEELKTAIDNSMKESFEKKVLVEEFIEGEEYSVEYISYRGKHYFLALTKKFTTGAPNFIEIKHMEPANVENNLLEKIKKIIEHALDSLEIKNGASHSEIKIDNYNNIKIVEIGSRMGGDCIGSDLVKYSTGYDYVKMVVQVALGQEPDFTKIGKPISVESVFIFTKEDLEKFEELKKNNYDKILKVVDFHPENIGLITDSSNRAGCYIKKL